ncbi:UPF0182 family protein [Corynebacterium choanae]|uniref:UPF0182 protein CCHOA_02660 n=1 Tax=Corynebacterium choanae TaxID=1862358 RepID=A0A3G6J4S8_9CORY|nr:UPF0182 family protein [Corynebacterium choanae]AZA12949.1 hypothetical protein CCHOA_02660 [Corynebacterium choanae]
MAEPNRPPIVPGLPQRRPPVKLVSLLTVLAAVAFLTPVLIGFITDWQWFSAVNYQGVFTKALLLRLSTFVVFALVAYLVVGAAGWLAYRSRPADRPGFEPGSPLHAYRDSIDQSLKRILLGVPLVVAIGAGLVGQANWTRVAMMFNAQDFGVTDPQFGRDLGFYAFILPFLQLVAASFSLLLGVAFIVSLLGHYLLGGIRAGSIGQGKRGTLSKAARTQLAVIAGLWMLVKVFTYWLDRYALLSNEHLLGRDQASFTGGNYTDINAVLPAKILLMVIGAVVAVTFFATVVLKDLRIPALATALMVLSSLVIGAAWPAAVEQFSVKPNRAEKEADYIARNIAATRFAYGLTDENVTYELDWGAGGASNEAVANDRATLSNIRLLDPQVLAATFTQRQQLKNFYGFPKKLNIDRYTVDGELRDYVVAAREIDPNALTDNQRDWINRHTVYTHGNGLIAAPANKVDEVARDVGSTRGGYPIFIVSDLQTLERQAKDPKAEKLGIDVEQPRIYYGPVISSGNPAQDYAIVGSKLDGKSLEYDTDSTTYTYEGEGGVGIGNLLQRAIYAGRYQELNMLLSDRIDDNSKIIFNRDPRSRVEKVAPWLTTDSTTYPTVIDGKIKWIVDGYTTLDSLPYVKSAQLEKVTADALNTSGLNQNVFTPKIGYIRNSVKAVVDAYDGTVELYAFDEDDPVLKAWEGVFPETVKPRSEISPALMDHLRYPEDMFKVQREMIAKYHVDDAREFFTSDKFWSVPTDPTMEGQNSNLAQPPYYVVAGAPETDEASFQLITPFRGFERQFLAAHMTASSDPDTYGKITVRVLPTDTQTFGPAQAQDAMMSSDQIARDRSLWQATNDITNGNLLTLPVGGGEILYVEPIYTKRKGQESAFPKLLRVLVYYKGSVGYAPTIAEALTQVGIDPKAAADLQEAEQSAGDLSPGTPPAAAPGPAAGLEAVPSGNAEEAFKRLQDALANLRAKQGSSFEEYGRALDELDSAVRNYQQLTGNPQPAAPAEQPAPAAS